VFYGSFTRTPRCAALVKRFTAKTAKEKTATEKWATENWATGKLGNKKMSGTQS